MNYQEMLRLHSYKYQARFKDIPRDLTGLGLLERHESIPFRQVFVAGFNETPTVKPVLRDEQLITSGIGETVRPEAFPNSGYLGEGLGG